MAGLVTVIPVVEDRRLWNADYQSHKKVLIDPDRGLAVSWTYKDRKGTFECDLASMD